MAVDEVAYEFNPLEGLNIPDQYRAEALDRASNFIKEQILEYVSDGKSPVEGESFPRLDDEYADEEKLGDRTPNLENTGAMLDALEVVEVDGRLVVRIEGSQAGKAEGHNQHDSSLPHPLPRRRFIPDKGQTFKEDILDGLREILNDLEEPGPEGDPPEMAQERRVISITEEIAARLFQTSLFENVRIRRTGTDGRA